MMPKYQGDPRWVTLRHAGKCSKCGASLAKGSEAFYYPKGKHAYGATCCNAGRN